MTRDVIAEFCADYHAFHNIGAQRRHEQMRILRAFEATLGGDVQDAGGDAIDAYLRTLVARNFEPTTVRWHLNAIRPLFKWMWRQKLITGDRLMEVEDVAAPRGGRKDDPNPYTRKEIQRFWRDLDDAYPWCACGKCKAGERIDCAERYLRRWRSGSSKWKRVQAYAMRCQIEAIVALPLMGGLRREEVFRAGLHDIDPENAYIVVRGAAKNADGQQRDRIVPWQGGQSQRIIIQRWLDLRAELAPDHDSVWLSLWHQHRLKPLRWGKFEMLMRNVGRGYEFHRLRHTFATEALRAGMELEKLSKVLGHSSLQQTLGYAKLIDGDLVKAAERVEADFSRAVGQRPTLMEVA